MKYKRTKKHSNMFQYRNKQQSFKHRFPVYNGHEVTRCKDCRHLGGRMESGYYSCGNIRGCVETIPEGFCGWTIPKMDK